MIKTISKVLLFIFLTVVTVLGHANDNCASADTELNVQLSCINHESSYYSVVLNRNRPQNSDEQCQWLLGEVIESQNGCNMPLFAKADTLDFFTIRSCWIDMRLQGLQANEINSLYWHDFLHNYGTDEDTTARLQEWESFLNEYLDPKVAAGNIKWATFTEMAELYKSKQ